ncbi:hypothetical protein LUQ84_002397 [Hamiltosporidium tvaerminnensis]|nr:hypothetical protein LUQ84_002397 [Hamiltosporidium tvaerminnensis]
MTIDNFYTILYFLEYFRVKYDNKLRDALKAILYSLVKSNEMNTLDSKNISFHFTNQNYFSHKLYKIISQEYFKIMKFEINSVNPYFLKEKQSYFYNDHEGLYTNDKTHFLIINDNFNVFFCEKVAVNSKSLNLFALLLNTLDIKYLHIPNPNEKNTNAFCFVLENLKKKIDEIIFYLGSIYDKTVETINRNLNFVDLKKIVFIKSKIITNSIFQDHLSKIAEIIFYENKVSRKEYEIIKIMDMNNINI